MANKPLSAELQRPLDGEIWKDVVGFEGSYQVSNLGRIKRIARRGADGRRLSERIMRQHPMENGYLVVFLVDGSGSGRGRLVHRLVLEAFLGPSPSPDLECCHGDGTRTNNIPTNLSWGTRKDNAQDMVRHGRSGKGERNVVAAITEAIAAKIAEMRRAGAKLTAIMAATGAARSTVWNVICGNTWTHVTGGPIDKPKRRNRDDASCSNAQDAKAESAGAASGSTKA